MQPKSLSTIKALPMVAGANLWRGRVYVTVRGNGGNFAGEKASKVWAPAAETGAVIGEIVVERGRGSTSREWEANLDALRVAVAA